MCPNATFNSSCADGYYYFDKLWHYQIWKSIRFSIFYVHIFHPKKILYILILVEMLDFSFVRELCTENRIILIFVSVRYICYLHVAFA